MTKINHVICGCSRCHLEYLLSRSAHSEWQVPDFSLDNNMLYCSQLPGPGVGGWPKFKVLHAPTESLMQSLSKCELGSMAACLLWGHELYPRLYDHHLLSFLTAPSPMGLSWTVFYYLQPNESLFSCNLKHKNIPYLSWNKNLNGYSWERCNRGAQFSSLITTHTL